MTGGAIQDESVGSFNRRQQLFLRYIFGVLVDLTVLNMFNEYWDLVFIELFSISLLTAILLQFLLQVTIHIEHRTAEYFKKHPGVKGKVYRGFATWAILFISKLVILEAINFAFGDSVVFGGPFHGLVSFIVVVVAIMAAEKLLLWVYRSLA